MDTISIVSIISSALITIANIIIPIIKSSQENKHIQTQKELQLFYENKVNSYKDFCNKFGILNTHAYENNIQNFSESVSSAILFANNEVKKKLLYIVDILGDYFKNKEESLIILKSIYPETISLIATDLSETYKSITKKSTHLE